MMYGSFLYPQQIHFVKQTSLYHVIVKIEGVLLLKMDLWRTEEASISHLVCILCIFGTFVKQTNLLRHSPHQDSRGPLAQDGSVEDKGRFS